MRLTTLFILIAAGVSTADDQFYLRRLADNGIEANAASLRNYLASLHPDGEAQRHVRSLIEQLGAEEFEVREQATRQLFRMPILSRSMLMEAARSEDAEIRWRARSIIEHADQQSEAVYYAVMHVIASREIKGLVSPMLAAMPYFEKPHLRHAAHAALAATSRETDVALLVQGLSNHWADVRIASALALVQVDGEQALDRLIPLLADDDEAVRLAVAHVLANAGCRNCLPTLVDLLDSTDPNVRVQSISTLRALTRQKFSYLASADRATRAVAIASWRAWTESEGRTAELHFPLGKLRQYAGRILICNYSANYVVEIDDGGNETWRKNDLDHPWGVEALPNGNRLVAACNGKYVVELDASGKEVWRKDGLPGNPLSVQRLDNGNTLVSTGSAGRVLEISPDGGIAWEITPGGFVADARRLSSGLTLIANYNTGEVVEVDRAGNVVWRIGGFKNTRGAQRLPNGNTLITDNGNKRIVECDRFGNVVWKYEGLDAPYDCQRLADGRTLVADASGLRLVDSEGNVIWHRKMTSTGRIFAY